MWKNKNVKMEECTPVPLTKMCIVLIPYWIRFWQSIRKWIDADFVMFPNLANAGKYSTGLIVKTLGFFLAT